MLVIGNIAGPQPPLQLAKLSVALGISHLLELLVSDFSLIQTCLDRQAGLVNSAGDLAELLVYVASVV